MATRLTITIEADNLSPLEVAAAMSCVADEFLSIHRNNHGELNMHELHHAVKMAAAAAIEVETEVTYGYLDDSLFEQPKSDKLPA